MRFVACWFLALSCASSGAVTTVAIGKRTGTTARTFLAHGWEPWSATQTLATLLAPDDNGGTAAAPSAALATALGHLRGQTVRFGGISADWLSYVLNDTVSEACSWGARAPFTAGGACPYSTGALDHMLDVLLRRSGLALLFDLNELAGRDCTQRKPAPAPAPGAAEAAEAAEAADGAKPPSNQQWCGDTPAPWDTAPVRALLEHVRGAANRSGLLTPDRLVGFELGNELFAPAHLPREVAADDIGRAAALLQDVWQAEQPPRLFGSGTNDCRRHNSSEALAALAGASREHPTVRTGFSFHSYPGNAETWWNKSDLPSYLLNASWLREEPMAQLAPCLGAWNAPGGARAAGVWSAATEAAAMCGGSFEPGAPDTSSFIHGFFSIAMLGQFAQAGLSLVARWGLPQLLALGKAPWDPSGVAADFFLYSLYNSTVGHGVLDVQSSSSSGGAGGAGGADEAPLVFAHCAAPHAFGANGSVTLLVANPSAAPAELSLSLLARPRLEYVLTAPAGDLASRTPLLNGDAARPLALGADGALPPMRGAYCGAGGAGMAGGAAPCADVITLPPRSQGFFVLLGAAAEGCLADP